MNRLLRVADLVDGAPVGMPRVLAPLVPEAYSLHWSILDLGEVVAGERWDLNLAFVEQRVDSSPRGFELSFADLAAFAERVQRVVDGLFVGCGDSSRLPLRTEDAATVVESADMLVAAAEPRSLADQRARQPARALRVALRARQRGEPVDRRALRLERLAARRAPRWGPA